MTQPLNSWLRCGGQSGGLNPLYQIEGPRPVRLVLKLQFERLRELYDVLHEKTPYPGWRYLTKFGQPSGAATGGSPRMGISLEVAAHSKSGNSREFAKDSLFPC